MTRRTGSLTRALEVDIIRDLVDLERLVPEWDQLAVGARAQPFALPAMAIPWWRHLGRGELRVVTARTPTGELVGIAPFHRRRIAGLDVLRPLGHGLGAVTDLVEAEIKADVNTVLIDGLLSGSRPAIIHATDIPIDERALRVSRRRPDLAVHAILHDETPEIDLRGLGHVTDLLASPDRQRLRKLLARSDRSLASNAVSIETATEPAIVLAAFNAVLPLYDAAERDRPRLHFGRGRYRSFFVEALEALALRGQISLLTLTIDGEPAAFDVHIVSGGTAYAILGRFDPHVADVSPGHVLLRAGVQWAIDLGLDRLDLQLGGDRYKTMWSTTSFDTLDAVISTPRLTRAGRAAVSGASSIFTLRRRAASLVDNRTR